MFRGLFERFQQGVEGGGGEHVHLVDQIDLVGAAGRGICGIFPQRPDTLDAVVAGTVDLKHIETPSLGNLHTGIANAAGIVGRAILAGLAVQRLGQNTGGRGLSHPARADKEIRLRETTPRDGVLKSAGDMLLANNLLKTLRSVFSGKNAVAHRGRNLEPAG